jgi:anti-sigma factor RsiW
MTPTCDAVRSYLAAHVDGEATPLGTEAMAAHLQGCEDCAAAAAELRAYREAMARAYRQAAAPRSLARALRREARRDSTAARWMAASAAAVLLVAGAGGMLLASQRRVLPTLAQVAVVHHDAFASARAPLDVTIADPARLVAWFAGRVPFPIRLPVLDSPDLHLLGGRLMEVAGGLAGYVAYRKGDSIVSLGVAPAETGAPPRDSESEVFGSLRFHLSRMRGHNVIAWTDRGLAYALVSDLPAQGRASCTVCHAPGSGLRGVEGFHR